MRVFGEGCILFSMYYSKLFGKTRFDAPHDADSINAQLLVQGGFVEKLSAGIYQFLPLGLRVLKKINQIIREEMDRIDGQEILMATLHPIEIWQQTGRDKTMTDILYRTKTSSDKEFVLGPSHEETVTPLVKKYVQSYKDLPLSVYQIQAKFRDEPRAKSGLLRGREFGMKDMYSFHETNEDLNAYYERAKVAYMNVYTRCGLEAYILEASGGAFTDQFSHEFSIKTPAGEDTMIYCEKCRFAQNIEVFKGDMTCPKCQSKMLEAKAIEAGNIFKLGTKFSEAFDLTVQNRDGKKVPVIMGCYGIGNTRLLGTVAEASHDENGIIWPKNVAPFQVHLISLGNDEKAQTACQKLYRELLSAGIEVLFDDRNDSAGKKFKDADLIGIPLRIVVSGRTLEKNAVEWKERAATEAKNVVLEEVTAGVKEWLAD